MLPSAVLRQPLFSVNVYLYNKGIPDTITNTVQRCLVPWVDPHILK